MRPGARERNSWVPSVNRGTTKHRRPLNCAIAEVPMAVRQELGSSCLDQLRALSFALSRRVSASVLNASNSLARSGDAFGVFRVGAPRVVGGRVGCWSQVCTMGLSRGETERHRGRKSAMQRKKRRISTNRSLRASCNTHRVNRAASNEKMSMCHSSPQSSLQQNTGLSLICTSVLTKEAKNKRA